MSRATEKLICKSIVFLLVTGLIYKGIVVFGVPVAFIAAAMVLFK